MVLNRKFPREILGNHDSWCPGRDSSQDPYECESEALKIKSKCSAFCLEEWEGTIPWMSVIHSAFTWRQSPHTNSSLAMSDLSSGAFLRHLFNGLNKRDLWRIGTRFWLPIQIQKVHTLSEILHNFIRFNSELLATLTPTFKLPKDRHTYLINKNYYQETGNPGTLSIESFASLFTLRYIIVL